VARTLLSAAFDIAFDLLQPWLRLFQVALDHCQRWRNCGIFRQLSKALWWVARRIGKNSGYCSDGPGFSSALIASETYCLDHISFTHRSRRDRTGCVIARSPVVPAATICGNSMAHAGSWSARGARALSWRVPVLRPVSTEVPRDSSRDGIRVCRECRDFGSRGHHRLVAVYRFQPCCTRRSSRRPAGSWQRRQQSIACVPEGFSSIANG